MQGNSSINHIRLRKKKTILFFKCLICCGRHTFSSLRIGDLQVAVCGLEALSGHNLLFKLTEGNMQPIESDGVVVQFGIKFIMNT